MKLVICEKPSVAKAVASALGVTSRADGCFEGNGLIVSWCVGHLVSPMDAAGYDPGYKKWKYDDLPILPEPFRYVPAKDKEDAFQNLKRLMDWEDVTELVNACDAGREGELIFRLAYEMAGCQKPFSRLWISSMEDAAIREGFQNLRPGAEYDPLYQSALCRQKADWLIGINATRLFFVPLPPHPECGACPDPHPCHAGGPGQQNHNVPQREVPSCAPDPGRGRGGVGEDRRPGGGGGPAGGLCRCGGGLRFRHP